MEENMSGLITPHLIVKKLWHIDLDQLLAEGIDTLLMDMDNTIVPWHTLDVPVKAKEWIAQAKLRGFKLFLISNNLYRRVEPLAKILEIDAVANACKPWPRGLRRLQKRHDILPEHCAMVGDQLLTDILAGNLWGIKTILVDPLMEKEGRMTWFNRTLEKFFLRRRIDYDVWDK